MKGNPLVSVVIPAFNRERTISNCLNSVLGQTYKDIEVVVVDDCSTDHTVQVVRNHPDPRVRCIVLERNSGAQAARNRGILEAKAEWIAFLDSDDEWIDNSIEVRLREAEKQGVDVVHSACYARYYPDTTLRPYHIPVLFDNVYKDLLRRPGPLFQCLLVKKSALERIGYLDESIISFQEWDTSIMLARYYEFAFTPEPTFIYNHHDADAISKHTLRAAQGYEQVFNKHREDMLRLLSRQEIAHHYRTLAKSYQEAKKYATANGYMKRTIMSYPFGLNLPRIAFYLSSQVAERLSPHK